VSQAQEWCGVHSVVGSGRTTLFWAQEWRRGLRDNACMVDRVTSSGRGRWRRVKRPRPRSGTMVQRLRGGLDGGMGSGEVDDGVGSREIFGGKFWQPDDMSESL
jgi:hypothetical protein